MKNMDLNPGGFIGALICGGAVGAFLFLTLEGPPENGRRIGKFAIGALIGGAFAGNYLWGIIFSKPLKEDAQENDA